MTRASDALTVLFIADVVGQPGFDMAVRMIPELIKQHRIDATIVNGENVNNGKSITEKQAGRIFGAGADVITGGNHTWENWQLRDIFAKFPNMIRPANYPDGNIGKGYVIVEPRPGVRLAVLNMQGRTFMYPIQCPFRYADQILTEIQEQTSLIFVDFHAEATAEKIALGWYLDGRVSAVVGTHTHVQTADERLLPKGTAYITDAGMTGPHDGVIGMDVEVAFHRFIKQTPRKFKLATENSRLHGVVIKIDKSSGKAKSIKRIAIPENQVEDAS